MLKQFNNNSNSAFFFRLIISLGLMAAIGYGALTYYGFLNDNQPRVARKASKEQAATVDTLLVKFEDVTPLIENFGQIVSAKQLPLSATVSGRVSFISENFKNGAIVKQGELLLEIDDFNYRGNLMTAKANLQDIDFKATDIDNQVASTQINYNSTLELYKNAEIDYQGSIKLQKSGIISKQALDDKNQALIQQKQSLDSMSASFDNLKNQKLQLLASTEVQKWAVDKAMLDLEGTKIYAPFDAYIHNASIEAGQHLNANTAIATLLDQQRIDVKFTLSDGQYGRIIAQDGTIIGREIKAVWKIGQIEKTFNAVINRVNSEIVAASGGIDLYASIVNVEAVEALRIGAFVQVLIPDQTYGNVIRIPDYVIYDNDVVYVVARGAVDEPKADADAAPKAKTTATAATDAERQAKRKARREARLKAGGQDGANRPKQAQANQVATEVAVEKVEDNSQKEETDKAEPAKSAADRPQRANRAKAKQAELKENERRLEPVKVTILGYDGDQIIIANIENGETPLMAGDSILKTRLSLAGKGVLVITSEESARKQAEALKKLKENAEAGDADGNRRFGRRGAANVFGGGGGGGRR